jgi:cystathionine gamma-lyase
LDGVEPGASSRLGDGTRAVHAGLPRGEQGAAVLPGPTFATGYHLRGDDLASTPYGYARYGNPTWSALEAALGELEGDGAQALVFPSGSAAIAAVLYATLSAGDVVVVPDDAYPAARTIAEELARGGVELRAVPTDTEAIVAACAGAALVVIETPSNPGLDVADVRAVADAAHAAGARLVVDNTLATPLGQRPLALGADVSVLSASKHLTGHSDLLVGSVASRDAELLGALRRWRNGAGAILGPFEAWLAHRSLATLDVRLARQCENALALATWLSGREDAGAVRYPGLPDDPAHALAARQMTRFGSVLTFDLLDGDRARRFLAACELVIEATSFGGIHTTAERRARWGIDDVSPGLIRLNAGIEDLDDLVADLTQALDASR